MHHTEDAYDKFEEISALVKQTDLKFKDPKFDHEVNKVYGAQAVTERQRWVQRSKNLLDEVSISNNIHLHFITTHKKHFFTILSFSNI